jgi:hypothetical protein
MTYLKKTSAHSCKFVRTAVFASVLACAAAHAQENYSTWAGHRNVFLNTTISGAGVAGTVTNFPVLVRLSTADSTLFAQARGNGADIRFTKADNTTRFAHQIDLWDSAGRKAAVWVKVDSVKGNNSAQMIRMHWGKADAADSSKGSAVFTNGFADVWHLGDAAGSTPRPNALAGRNTAVPVNVAGDYAPRTGMIGKADTLRGGFGGTGPNGSNIVNYDRIDLGANTNDYANGFTFSTWVYPTKEGLNVNYYVASSDAFGTNGNVTGLIIAGTSSSRGVKFRQRNSGTANVGIINTGSGELDGLDSWRHVVYTKEAGTGSMLVYRDGEMVAIDGGGLEAFSTQARAQNWLGSSHPGLQYSDSGFAGLMDEARLATTSRSADWVRLEYQNQKAAQSLVFFDSVPAVALARAPHAFRANGLTVTSSRGAVRIALAGGAGSAAAAGAHATVLDLHGRVVWRAGFPTTSASSSAVSSMDRSQTLTWNGADASGRLVPAGLYAVRVIIPAASGTAARTLDHKVLFTR